MFPKHVFPDTAQVNRHGHLSIGGCDVVDLAFEYGTPLYVFDEVTLRARCQSFVREFSNRYPSTTVLYASKAFMNKALVRLFMEEGLGLDVVSGGELALAQAVGFPRERVYFHGNNKTRQELEEALDWGIGRIVVDSFHELRLLNLVARSKGVTQDILIRVSPEVDPHTHVHTSTGILDSKFGFPMGTGDAKQAVLDALEASNLRLVGIHFHLGSPIFELEPYVTAIEKVLAFASRFREEGLELREFSPGGGFAIAYLRSQSPPTIAQYAGTITGALLEGCETYGLERPRLLIEPGRAIVGPAAVAVYHVGAIKNIPGVRKYVSVNGGMGDNIRPALYDAKYEAVVANRMDVQPSETVTIAGKYCESGDILVRDVALPPVESGDIIAIPAAGAYSPSMASNYNLNPLPAIVLVKDGKARLIRRRQTYQDMMSLDVE